MSDAMSLSRRDDALEAKMAQELDYIVVKSRLHMLAEADLGSPPNAGALMKANPNARVLMGDDPRLPAMPEKPTLVDFFKHRFGPSMHLLQSARHAVTAGLPEKMVLACLLHDIAVVGFIRGDHGYWGAQLIEPYVDEVTDIIGRNFRQPEQGLGFDNSPVAHMWRAMIRPAKYL